MCGSVSSQFSAKPSRIPAPVINRKQPRQPLVLVVSDIEVVQVYRKTGKQSQVPGSTGAPAPLVGRTLRSLARDGANGQVAENREKVCVLRSRFNDHRIVPQRWSVQQRCYTSHGLAALVRRTPISQRSPDSDLP